MKRLLITLVALVFLTAVAQADTNQDEIKKAQSALDAA
jgi:hypothetical protein